MIKKKEHKKQRRLTVGCRVRVKTLKEKPKRFGKDADYEDFEWSWREEYGGREALLLERDESATFDILVLAKGTKELRKDPKIIDGGGAWVPEDDMVLVDSDFDANLDFIDWYNENHDSNGNYEGDSA